MGTDFRFSTRGRWSMTREEALATLSHQKVKLLPLWLTIEARKVVKAGVYWRWWDGEITEV